MRRATHYDNYNLHCVEISIHALLAESDGLSYFYIIKITISIHALLAESDKVAGQRVQVVRISIHALLAESDWAEPVRNLPKKYFYPRSPCGERPTDMRHRLIEL